MKSMRLSILMLVGLSTLVSFSESSGQVNIPRHVSYQGQLVISGVPHNDNPGEPTYFKFAIIHVPSGNTLWSNDGVSVDGSEPSSSVAIEVSQGLFSVLLGGEQGMVPLSADLLDRPDPSFALRVWVDTGSGFSQLTDQPLSATPFALSSEAARLSIGEFDVGGALNVAEGIKIGNSAATDPGTIRWNGTDFEGYDGSLWTSLSAAGDSVLTLPYSGAMSAFGDAFTITKAGNSHSAGRFINSGQYNTEEALLGATAGRGAGVMGINAGATGNAGYFSIPSGSANASAALFATTWGTGPAASFNITANGHPGPTLYVRHDYIAAQFEGRVGIGTASPLRDLDISGNIRADHSGGAGPAAEFSVSLGSNGNPAVIGRTAGTGNAARFEVTNVANTQPALVASTLGTGPAAEFSVSSGLNGNPAVIGRTAGTGNAARFEVTNVANTQPALVASTLGTGPAATFYGAVGIGTAAPNARLSIENVGPNDNTKLLAFDEANGSEFYIESGFSGTGSSDNHIKMKSTWLFGPLMLWRGDGTVEAGGGKFKIRPDGRVVTPVLEITGGADLAEPFPMGDGEPVPEGALVVIDSENPGQLRMSTMEYDTRVAGVVSGAGGVRPGVTLTQLGTDDSAQDVALTGRVYALADASYGAIEPGDLLTTSNTPGHARKASDGERSHGAVIGKAMSRLTKGKGLVLVLVNLQ